MFAWKTICKSFASTPTRVVETKHLPIIPHLLITTDPFPCPAPLVVQNGPSEAILNLNDNFHQILEDIVTEMASMSTTDTMLNAANAYLEEARQEASIADIINITDIAKISPATMLELAKRDRLERKAVYTTLVDIIKSTRAMKSCRR